MFSAFEIALRLNDNEMITLLYELSDEIDLNYKNIFDYGHTPLMQMAQLGDMDKIHWLLEKGANLHEKDTYNDQVLAIAAYNGQKEVVKFLLTLNVDVLNKNNFGDTAYDHAKTRGHNEVADMIKEKVEANKIKSGIK